MIVATAGHIDHGKTTLVRALTGVDTDRLPEEKARGISIDLGFAHADLGPGLRVGFVDVPGHERFVRNMLSGVYAVGHVLLVIAADDGVMPQTREHLHIVHLLGVGQGTVVLTKRDRVDAAQLARVEAEAGALLAGTALEGSPAIAVSAVSGEGLDALRRRLADVALAARAPAETAALARYVVDRVFTSPGSGTVVTGTVIAGRVAAGDTLVISPAGTAARVRKLQRHGVPIDAVHAGERAALNLAGVEHSAVARGDWLVAPELQAPTDRLDVRLNVLASEAAPLRHWMPLHVHLGAADVPARLALRRGAALAPGTGGLAQLRLVRPVHAVHGDRFIVRDQSASRTLGGGVVVDPLPPRRRRGDRAAALAALQLGEPRTSLAALLAPEAQGASGVVLETFRLVFGLSLAAAEALVPAGAVVVVTDVHTVFAGAAVKRLEERLAERVKRFHAEHRGVPGMEIVPLQAEVSPGLAADVFLALFKRVAPAARLSLQGSLVRLAGHDSTDNPRDLALWQRVVPLLMQAGFALPSVRDLSGQVNVPLQTLRDLLHRKSGTGALVKVTPERFALPDTMEQLEHKARETAAGKPGGLFSAAQYRDTIGTGRGLAIEILECLDRRGATQRRGDQRTVRGPAADTASNP